MRQLLVGQGLCAQFVAQLRSPFPPRRQCDTAGNYKKIFANSFCTGTKSAQQPAFAATPILSFWWRPLPFAGLNVGYAFGGCKWGFCPPPQAGATRFGALCLLGLPICAPDNTDQP